ncbi:MAG: FecR domain-containing protein [Bacteroidales bacterium]|nr:FecR domain-containing protein [Bacteroidales bacterium]
MKPKKDFEEHLFNNLGTFQSIDIEEDWQKVRGRIGYEKSRRLNPARAFPVALLRGKRAPLKIRNGSKIPRSSASRIFNPVWRTAAAVILLLGVGFLAQKYLDLTPDMIAVQSGDQMKEVLLPDGSSVTLNKQTKLIYPEKFRRRQRELKLIGEAFFEVVSNPALPFIVDVDQRALIRVLGTSFNISTNESGESISVQVIEGRVAFSSSLDRSDEIILVKDEQATLTEGSVIRDDTVDRNFLSWKTGKLIFDHENIAEVFRQLQAHYEIEIVLHKSVHEELSFTSTLDNQDMESVLDEISMVLGLEYSYEDEKVIFSLPE